MLYTTAREDLQPYVSAGHLARSQAFHDMIKALVRFVAVRPRLPAPRIAHA